MTMRLASLYRYPVKGLSPERLDRADLGAGDYFPGDRLYAVENGPSGFDPASPRHQPKIKFLMLMRNESLARLRTRYLDDTSTLVVEEGGREVARGDLSTPEGRTAVEAFFDAYVVPPELRGAPKVLDAPTGYRFTDSPKGFVSIINLASVAAVEGFVGAPVDPLRFRANLYVEGLEPWSEFDLVGRTIANDAGVRLEVTKRIVRCAATNVDPQTGARDLDLPRALMGALGHADCGVYAEVVHGGPVTEGDRFVLN